MERAGGALAPLMTLACALLPGAIMLWSGAGVPKDYRILFGSVTLMTGALVWTTLRLRPDLPPAPAGMAARRSSLACLVLLLAYVALYLHCAVTVPPWPEVFFPLWLSGPGASEIAFYGSRRGAVFGGGSSAVELMLNQTPAWVRHMTTVLLLLVLQAVVATGVLPLCLAVLRAGAPAARPHPLVAPSPDAPPGTAALRALIQRKLLTDADLDAFCQDHFPTVFNEFTAGMLRQQKITLLLQTADRETLIARLDTGSAV